MGRNSVARFLFLILVFFIGCEKDDICVEGDTPLLVIRFYDAQDSTALKTVTGIRVIGSGQSSPVDTFTDRATLDSIAIPLRINLADTAFLFIENSADEDGVETGNTDTLTFSYEIQEKFVSRACGFVANYENLSEVLTSDAENWIQGVEIVSPSVNNQTSAHVKIFH